MDRHRHHLLFLLEKRESSTKGARGLFSVYRGFVMYPIVKKLNPPLHTEMDGWGKLDKLMSLASFFQNGLS